MSYRRFVASIPGPKIIVMQDLDKPAVIGSFWGEVSSTSHKSVGCVGTIVDGAIRDLDEMRSAGFKAIARRLCVGHAYAAPISWGEPVEVFGTRVKTGDLIHTDKHGFLVIPEEDQPGIMKAARFMDDNECDTVIAAGLAYKTAEAQIRDAESLGEAAARFAKGATAALGRGGEWK